MVQLWEVVGGVASGGILVREGKELSSGKMSERLSTGALVKELELADERLHFERLTGSGPGEGWVGIALNGKPLVVKTDKAPPAAEPASTGVGKGSGYANGVEAAPVADKAGVGPESTTEVAPAVDEALKQRLAAAAKEGAEAFDTWCFKYKVSKFPVANCRLRVFCFHNAGSAESVWTGPAQNELLSWVKNRGDAELVAMSYPGRDKLVKSPPHESTESLVDALLPVLYNKIADGVPYVILAHSVGTWVAFDMLMTARKAGLPMPKAAFFNGFAGPQLPVSRRPWRISRNLSSDEMKDEVRAWDPAHFGGAAKVIFEKDWKPTWEPLMRADFKLFDEYECRYLNEPKFDFPIFSFYMGKEHFIKPDMAELWKDWTEGKFSFSEFEDMGHLTCVYQPPLKKVYTAKIVECLKEVGV